MLTPMLILLAGLASAQDADPWSTKPADAPAEEPAAEGADEATSDDAEEGNSDADGAEEGDGEAADSDGDDADGDDADGDDADGDDADGDDADGDDADGEDASGDDDGAEAGLPAGVEAGSTRTVYVVEDGDTLNSIAIAKGFLPSDLRAWNDIEGQVAAGDELVLWVAPIEVVSEPEPEPEPAEAAEEAVAKAKKEKKEKAPSSDDGDKQGLGMFAGLQVGPAFSLNPLKPAVTPRLELGVELPPMDRSWRIFVGVQYLKPVGTGTISDDRVGGGSADYELKQDELSVNFGPTFRLGMLDGKVIPEFSVGPNIFMYRSTINGSAGGSAFPESTEQYTRVGIYGAGGVGVALGPGELTGLLTIGSSALGGVVSGEAASAALSPTVGYRFVF